MTKFLLNSIGILLILNFVGSLATLASTVKHAVDPQPRTITIIPADRPPVTNPNRQSDDL